MTVSNPNLTVKHLDDGSLVLLLSGNWRLDLEVPTISDIKSEFNPSDLPARVSFETVNLSGWDSSLLTFLVSLIRDCNNKNIPIQQDGLPDGVRRLLALAATVPERARLSEKSSQISILEFIGEAAVNLQRSTMELLTFIGEVFLAFLRMFTGEIRFRRSDLLLIIQDCSAKALPIVSLISLLVGLILAYVGAIQLRMFGAQIYVADLVGIGIVRAMGAIMVGIVMAGRTGASFAAQLGTMQVNEEIDALQTTGISPIEFLVVPRMLALAFIMPLLTLYADFMGIMGGLIVGILGLNLSFTEYFNETIKAVSLTNVWIGLFSSFVFGILVALSGCLRGIQCGRSASAVGKATTSAVVTGIVSIVVATAIITVSCDILGI